MTRTTRWLTVLWICCALVTCSFGQQQPQPVAQSPVKIQTNEVLLDVVVHDKKGKPVRDLKPEEIEIYEDGVKQTPSKFVLVGEPTHSTTAKSEQATDSPSQLNLVTLLIDHLTAQRVQPVRDAAFNFIDNSLADNVLVRVMVVGRKLYVIEQFTNDRAKLKKAVERATGTVEKSFAEISKRIAAELQPIASENSPLAAISESLHTQPSPEAQLAKMTLDTLSASEKLSGEIKSNLHVFSLLPFARAHRLMPGRKMALYFSDGLYMPSGMSEVLRTVVSEANRANLTFYTVNIRNLLVGAGNQVSRLETATVVNSTRRPESSTFNGAVGDSFSTSDRVAGRGQINTNFNMFEVVDRNKEMNKKSPLTELSENTGGFLLTNINDLNGALKRVAVDLGRYYSISYVPTKQEYDGKYRTISVKLKRSGLKTQTRNGYFALPPSAAIKRPEISFEAPLLSALNDAVVPHDFQFQAGTLHFEARQNEIHTAVLIATPLANFVQQEDKDKKNYSLKFATLGMVKDDKGEIVQRFSEPHELNFPAASQESIKQSVFTMARHFWLPPGRYTLETVAHDQQSNRISAQRQFFTVAAPRTGLQTSSLFLVKQVEQIDANANNDLENPLLIGDKRIIPDLTQSVSIAGRNELSFDLAIFPDPKSAEKPLLKLELLLDNKVIAKTSPELPKPDETGRINFTAGIPAAGLVPGKYRFHAVAAQSGSTCEENLDFVIPGERPKETTVEEKTIASALGNSDKVGELTLVALKTFNPVELSPNDLLQEVEKAGAQMYGRLGDYTYSLRKVRRVLNAKGKIKGEDFQDFEAYPVKGKHALIQFAENGSRLALTRIDLNRRSATDQLLKSEMDTVKAESPTDSTESVAAKNTGYWSASLEGMVQRRGQPRQLSYLAIDPEAIFKACEFSSPRMVMLEDRETIVMDFRPRAGLRLGQDQDWIQKLSGTVWIDAAERSLVRIEGQNLTGSAEKEEGSEVPLNFVYQQQRLAAGVWSPLLIRINSAGDENLFRGLNWDAWFEFTNFKRFDARDSDVKIISPGDKK
ncbi:MAG: VWA domain-containing protein [Acidobacteriota bacterium]|nr:VWA domain-containing protein [Acidobacteriota bacterium]